MATSTPDSWYVSAYWAVYRFFRFNRFATPTRVYREVKWFIQRGSRGWADCDVWSIDWYLNRWMPDALRRLKATKHGIPGNMFPEGPEYVKDCGNPNDAAWVIAEARWDGIMNKMIAGFEAAQRINEMTNFDDPVLRKADEAACEEGLKLFVEYYFDLWD